MEEKIQDLKERYIHRDISWLLFNERVLEEAEDQDNPLLERLKFFAIFVQNLDEFFMVRVAGLKRLLDAGYNKKDAFGYYPDELFNAIRARIETLLVRLYDRYNNVRAKELKKNKIVLKQYEELNEDQKKYIKRYFEGTLFPALTPMAVDEGRPFPSLASKTMGVAVHLSRYEKLYFALLPLPKSISRVVKIPSETDEFSFVLLEDIVRQYLPAFFKGYKVTNACVFRLIRDSELSTEEGYTVDLLKAIESQVKKRPKAKVVYLEVEKSTDASLVEQLCQGLDFAKEEVISFDPVLDISYLFELVGQISEVRLCFPALIPAKYEYSNIFDKIKEGDFLVHLPFESFGPIVDFIQTAANDRDVLAIKMTLYRTNEDSAIIRALKDAAKKKKQVTVLVEIKARFDEERNISGVRELEEAGCHVLYGIAGMKIHSKIALVVRKEEGQIVRYVHLSTGNYNEISARLYTDISYFTCNDDAARDISDLFNVITGYSLPSRWTRVISSPNDLRQYFFELIDKEIEFQKKYQNGYIVAKMNSLEDILMIEKLYEASAAGVKIRLMVRGICCLIPGVKGLSDHIEVKSIVGRFLEHSRIFIFNNNAEVRVFISSADWMRRNFDSRIELLFEVYQEELKQKLIAIMDTYAKDSAKSRILMSKKEYTRLQKTGASTFNAQESLIASYSPAAPKH